MKEGQSKTTVFTASIRPEEIYKNHPSESPLKLALIEPLLEMQAEQIDQGWSNLVMELKNDSKTCGHPYLASFGESTLLLFGSVTPDESKPKEKVLIAITPQGPYSIPVNERLLSLIGNAQSRDALEEGQMNQEGIIENRFQIFPPEKDVLGIGRFPVERKIPTFELIKEAIRESRNFADSITKMPELITAKRINAQIDDLRNFIIASSRIR